MSFFVNHFNTEPTLTSCHCCWSGCLSGQCAASKPGYVIMNDFTTSTWGSILYLLSKINPGGSGGGVCSSWSCGLIFGVLEQDTEPKICSRWPAPFLCSFVAVSVWEWMWGKLLFIYISISFTTSWKKRFIKHSLHVNKNTSYAFILFIAF